MCQLKAGLADFCDTMGKNLTGQELIQLMFREDGKTHFSDDDCVDKYIWREFGNLKLIYSTRHLLIMS